MIFDRRRLHAMPLVLPLFLAMRSASASTLADAAQSLEAWEPDDFDYFGHFITEFSVGNLSRAEFDARIRAGRPFVVRGAGRSRPMENWDCSFFRKDPVFRDVEVKKEYDRGTEPADKFVKLRDVGITTPKANGQNSIAPYYLGIKDAVHNSPAELAADSEASVTWTTQVLSKIQDATVPWSFMDARNERIMRRTPELWFSTATSSAKAHVDSHTESTVSLQLSGQKRWRVSLMRKRNSPHIMRLYSDGQVSERPEGALWQRLADVTLDAGDAIFFGPGFIHETRNLHPSDVQGKDTCAASITYQFNVPEATGLYRDFMQRFRWTPDLEASWRMIRRWVDAGRHVLKTGVGAREELQKGLADDPASFLDRNGDGVVTVDEAEAVVSAWEAVERSVHKAVPKNLLNHGFGLHRTAEYDALHEYPAKIRKAIERFETEALRADEAGRSEL